MAHIHLDKVSVQLPIYGVGKRVFKKELIRIATGGFLKKENNNILTVDALKNITLDIPNGMRLGLIGHNGAGKSTLLRTIIGIYEPSSGKIKTEGKVTSILDLMIGINEESTGYENIFIQGLLQGFTRTEIEAKKEAIAKFTELGDYLWMPIRTYSSGMKIRLAFGIATSFIPEILVIDEVFGAGDSTFIEKAQNRMQEMIRFSSIVIFTSHDLSLIKKICTHVLWLDAGQQKFFGPVEEGIEYYQKFILSI